MAGEGAAVILSDSVLARLQKALMRAELLPHQRLKVRDLAREMGTSETPVREALVQLASEGAIEFAPRAFIRVRRLSLAEYAEIIEIRLELEPMAAECALPQLSASETDALAALHDRLILAEQAGDWKRALQANTDFHFGLYSRAARPVLLEMLRGLWTRLGPMLTELYPDNHPTYAGRHQHLEILDAIRARDARALRHAVRMDLIEGSRRLRAHLAAREHSPSLTGSA